MTIRPHQLQWARIPELFAQSMKMAFIGVLVLVALVYAIYRAAHGLSGGSRVKTFSLTLLGIYLAMGLIQWARQPPATPESRLESSATGQSCTDNILVDITLWPVLNLTKPPC